MPFTTIGKQAMMSRLMGEATFNLFDNTNARIGVGDSATAFAVGQVDLQAATNKLRKGMVATYPQRAGAVLTFRSEFTGSEANWTWAEWAIFNGTGTAAPSAMLSRKVEALGTKASGATWTLTVTIEP